jgi:hypothetical protein
VFRYLGRHKIGVVALVFVAIASTFSVYYFLSRSQRDTLQLYKAKLLMLRVDDVPFPKKATTPIDVMEGSPVVVSCENIIPPAKTGKASYRFHVGGKTTDSSVCERDFALSGKIDSVQKIGLEYFFAENGKEKKLVDKWDALVRIVQSREYIKIRNFGKSDGTPLEGHTVPREVIPYVEAALPLDGPSKDYEVLFFVEAMGTGVPILQATGKPNAEHRVEAIVAPVTRYRGFGRKKGGYAAWPSVPIQIGGLEDERAIFEVYAGIFETKKVQAVVDQLLTLDEIAQDGQAVVKVVQKTVEEIRQLAWRRWLSEPMRVVRAANTPEENDRLRAATLSGF